MPRRIPDDPEAFAGWNMMASLGSYLSFAGFLVFLLLVWRTLAAGKPCPANPWGKGATTLEWTLSSPPPFHSFDELPKVRSEEHTSELQSLMRISYAVFCLKKKNTILKQHTNKTQKQNTHTTKIIND